MATERLPGYDVLVGCYEEDVHRANLADDNWLYLIGLDASGTPQGFAALQNRHDGDGSEFLRRVAVANAGRGFGKPFPIGNEPQKTIEPPVRIALGPCCELVLHFADYQRSSPRLVR